MRSFLALYLALALAAPALPQGQPRRPVTMVGDVWINHVQLPTGAGVTTGDRIRTADDAMAVVLQGGRTEVRPASEVIWGDREVELLQGGVASDARPVVVDQTRIEPADTSADNWIVVVNQGDEHLVAAYRGDTWIRRPGAEPLLVRAGSYALAPAPAMPQAVPSESEERTPPARRRRPDSKRKSRKRGAGAAGAAGGWTIGNLGPGMSMILLTGVGAAAVTGTVLGVSALQNEAASPAQ